MSIIQTAIIKFNKVLSSSRAIQEVQILLHVRNLQLEEGREASPTRCIPEIIDGIFISNIRRQWLKKVKNTGLDIYQVFDSAQSKEG